MSEQGTPGGVDGRERADAGHASAASTRQTEVSGAEDADSASVLREMLVIAIPSVATMASYTVMQFTDKLMVSRIGPEPVYVSAQSNGGILAWTLVAFLLGMTGVVNSFVSQNYGAGKPERGAAYAVNGLYMSVAYYLFFVLPLTLAVPAYFARLHAREEMALLVELETQYAVVMLVGTLPMMCARTLHHYFYGLHRPWVVLVSALSANILNVLLNIVLIFGDEGLRVEAGWIGAHVLNPFFDALASVASSLGIGPRGILGAAYATVAGAVVELLIPLGLFLSPRYARRFGTRRAWGYCSQCVRGLLRVGLAPGLMFVNEIVCWNMLMVWLIPMAGEAMGDDPVLHNTTGWIALQYMHLSFMPAVGLSIAAQAMVGKCMGMGRADLATRRAVLALKITMGYMGLCALVFVLFRAELIALFIDEATPVEERARLVAIGSRVMIAAAVFQLFDALAITTSAALRGAGDTVWPGVATIVLSWTCIIALGLAFIALLPGLGSLGPWIGASLYIILLGVVLGIRFARGKWKTLSLVDADDGPDLDPMDEAMPDPTVGAV